jgi:hypothetical protein
MGNFSTKRVTSFTCQSFGGKFKFQRESHPVFIDSG